MKNDDIDYIGVDIGGSHITVARIDKQSRCIETGSIQREYVDAHMNSNEIIKKWGESIQKIIKNKQNTLIGIAMPGPFDYKEGISYINGQDKFDDLYKKNVKILIANELNMRSDQIEFVNDAASFLQGEILSMGKEGLDSVIGITLGTGLGSAYTQYGQAFDADLWRFPFKNGIAEDYLSTRWFVKKFYEATGEKVFDLKDILERYQQHPYTTKMFAHFSNNLASFLYQFVDLKEPELIVIGGNMSKAGNYFLNEVDIILKKQHINVPIRLARLGEKATLMGAVYNWIIT
ncbi:ROK family protein [Galbibacter pacificus]|uniref:ROK family protein n=1 Tax=Galbibacter pacificus TaxID=2996052 RepID=A0ABT6FMP3_9FLAO|nr:ROK family protein [Galbibacter pacificus]MDG3581054.1 ROK family protein [Galbibacter pacificus]MDG3584532.1 ROK family protein [Galbibacter pacificus]